MGTNSVAASVVSICRL